jgi:hypothetical protein
MKIQPQPRPIQIPPEIAAKCDAPNQAARFDRMFRHVIAVPKAEIDRRDAKWKRAQARKKRVKKGL